MQKSKKRPRQPASEQEKLLEELVFGKNVIAADIAEEKAVKTKAPTSDEVAAQRSSVWEDEDDDKIEVDMSKTDRLKKLRRREGNQVLDVVSGTELTSLLKERFQTRKMAWAEVSNKESHSTGRDILSQSGSMVLGSSESKGGALPAGRLDIRRVVDANADSPSKKDINAIRFHPNGNLLLAGGEDKYLKIFRIDGDQNQMQVSVRFNDMAIKAAEFVGGPTSGEVILGGRRPYFYSYDTSSGTVSKLLGCMGREVKSHESLSVSPAAASGSDKGFIAIQGIAGYVHILCAQQKTWVTDVKIPSGGGVRAMHFIDEHTVCASGGDAEVYIWDLRASRVGDGSRILQRFRHDDGTYTSCLTSPRSGSTFRPHPYLAVGAESGVVSVFDMARSAAREDDTGYGKEKARLSPSKMKSIMNLTMMINAMAIHPSGELLAIGSDQRKDQLKMIHLPTCSVFNNWPTDRTPLGRVKCLDFSPGGAFFAHGDHRGRVTLHRLGHYTAA